MASTDQGWEYSLRKNLMLLATIVATVTYSAGFNPPGGVWQDTDAAAGHLAGDPVIRATSYTRYGMFFYANATAFASSLMSIVLILILTLWHDRKTSLASMVTLYILRFVMVLDLLCLMGAYGAGTSQDTRTTILSLVYMILVAVYLLFHNVLGCLIREPNADRILKKRTREVLMLLATFGVSVTYQAGLNPPGGFWDSDEGGHRPGDPILKGRHDKRLKVFLYLNGTAFTGSVLIITLLLNKNLSKANRSLFLQLQALISLLILSLVGAYSAGSSRENSTTIYMAVLVAGFFACIFTQRLVVMYLGDSVIVRSLRTKLHSILLSLKQRIGAKREGSNCGNGSDEQHETQAQISRIRALVKARSLVELLATLAVTITYQAGLDPPGGLWQEDGDGHKAGDPILRTRSPRRYKAFFYCNSIAFVASLVSMILLNKRVVHKYHALEAAMILDLFGLIGAYAAGSCRDVSSSIYAIGLAGAVLVYVVIHIVFFTLDHEDSNGNGGPSPSEAIMDDRKVEKRRQRLLLFAIMGATLTYQAGLTPPSGFRLQDDEAGHRAGDPVLLYNYPRRYKAFFYCNSVSFMLSISLIILLVNRNLYRPAIRSNALSVCTAAGTFGLVGAFAAGSTQHLKTSFYIFGLAAVVIFFVVVLVLLFCVSHMSYTNASSDNPEVQKPENGTIDKMKLHAMRMYVITLGSLAASVTYQAGLKPPGGTWPQDSMGHTAGNPIMQNNRRLQYIAFFYINFASFVASGILIILQLLKPLQKNKWWIPVRDTMIYLDLIGLLIAYAVGSSRSWKTCGYVLALVIAVLTYVVTHVMLLRFIRKRKNSDEKEDGEHQLAAGANPAQQTIGVSSNMHHSQAWSGTVFSS